MPKPHEGVGTTSQTRHNFFKGCRIAVVSNENGRMFSESATIVAVENKRFKLRIDRTQQELPGVFDERELTPNVDQVLVMRKYHRLVYAREKLSEKQVQQASEQPSMSV